MSYIPFPEVSPEIFSIEIGLFTFALRWYAVAYIVGILLGWRLALVALARPALWLNGQPPLSPVQLERLISWLVAGVILGGRLGFVIFYQPIYFIENPLQIIRIWEGGMSFHGGFLGVLIAAYLFSRREKIALLPLWDVMALATPLIIFLVRIANFINAELWGRPTDLPWGVAFPGPLAQNCIGAANVCVRHPSQIYEALLEGALIGVILLWLAFRRGWLQRVGGMSGLFVALYAAARFSVEFVRQPDAQFISEGNPLGLAFHISGYGLTMGQLLSLPLFIAGLYLIRRRHGAPGS